MGSQYECKQQDVGGSAPVSVNPIFDFTRQWPRRLLLARIPLVRAFSMHRECTDDSWMHPTGKWSRALLRTATGPRASTREGREGARCLIAGRRARWSSRQRRGRVHDGLRARPVPPPPAVFLLLPALFIGSRRSSILFLSLCDFSSFPPSDISWRHAQAETSRWPSLSFRRLGRRSLACTVRLMLDNGCVTVRWVYSSALQSCSSSWT